RRGAGGWHHPVRPHALRRRGHAHGGGAVRGDPSPDGRHAGDASGHPVLHGQDEARARRVHPHRSGRERGGGLLDGLDLMATTVRTSVNYDVIYGYTLRLDGLVRKDSRRVTSEMVAAARVNITA